jgi:hypothetical protein
MTEEIKNHYYQHSLLGLLQGDIKAFEEECPGVKYDIKVALGFENPVEEGQRVEDFYLLVVILPIDEG